MLNQISIQILTYIIELVILIQNNEICIFLQPGINFCQEIKLTFKINSEIFFFFINISSISLLNIILYSEVI